MDERLYQFLVDAHDTNVERDDWETEYEFAMIEEAVMSYNARFGTTYDREGTAAEFLEQFHEENS